MNALFRLELQGCMSLLELPTERGSLGNLEILDISWSYMLGRLRKLRELHASYYRNLKGEMPESMGSLENLEILNISSSGIEELSNSIGRLRKLRKLDSSNCRNLKEEMPESMRNLSFLQHLDSHGYKRLQSLQDYLPSNLIDLGVTDQSRKLPSLSHLTHLKRLQVWYCKFLECIQVLPSTLVKNSECSQPTDVEESELPQSLNTFFKLEILDVSQFIHLSILSVEFYENLHEVRGLDKSIYLENLTVSSCNSIERLDLPKFEGLNILDVHYCDNLAEIQSLDRLEFLESLKISRCTSIEKLLLPKSGSLKTVDAASCKKLAEIQGLDRLEVLEMLNIERCTSIERLELSKSGRLKELKAGYCKNLAEIQGLNRLEFL